MTDNSTPAVPDTSLMGKVQTFFANPQVQTSLRAAFAASGPAYLWLTGHAGLNDQQIGMLYQAAIMFGPSIVVWVISMIQKTRAAIVNQAAKILAAQNAGKIVVNSNAQPSIAALAHSADSPVVPASSAAAVAVANDNPPAKVAA